MYCDKCRVIVKQRMNEMSRLSKVLKARRYVASKTNDWYLRKISSRKWSVVRLWSVPMKSRETLQSRLLKTEK